MKTLMNEQRFQEWYLTATQDEKNLLERVEEFAIHFEDMIFSNGTSTHKFVTCKSKLIGSDEWVDDVITLPEELEYFSYSHFTYHIANFDDFFGCFNREDLSLSVDKASANTDRVILHEMIHLHEFVIDVLPTFFHDAILFCLYKDLKSKISNLDERIEAHGHILNSEQIAAVGGVHDILFLLKSFDLDLKMGYQLGTVFGYGMVDEDYSVNNQISQDRDKGPSEALQGPPGGEGISLPNGPEGHCKARSESAGDGVVLVAYRNYRGCTGGRKSSGRGRPSVH